MRAGVYLDLEAVESTDEQREAEKKPQAGGAVKPPPSVRAEQRMRALGYSGGQAQKAAVMTVVALGYKSQELSEGGSTILPRWQARAR